MTETVFKGSMALLTAAFGRVLDGPTVKAYEIGVSDLTDEQMGGATARALRTCKFMPAPAELRELVGASDKANALIAWDAVRAAMRRYGYTTSVDFGPLVNAVVRNMGGWRRLDDMPTAELDVWGKKEFERVYALLAPKDPATLNGGALAGAFEGTPVRIAIAGHAPPPRQLPPAGNGASTLVRQLAEAKGAP